MRRATWNFIVSGLTSAYDRLYPPRCGFCGLWSGFICQACHEDLLWNVMACERCAVPLDTTGEICADCLITAPPWSRAYVPLRYAFPLDRVIKRFKFHAAQHYLPMFAALLRPTLERLPADIIGLQPMPLHWRRQARRGFNQAQELARPVAQSLSLPIVDLVRRDSHTTPQSSLRATERRRNMDRYFQTRGDVPYGHILIIDDVLTTGASVAALSRCLLQSGARDVSVLALARS